MTSFDLAAESRAELRELMREWSRAAAEMTAGQMVGSANDEQLAPPNDTGETVGLPPSRLTVTFGFGPSLFARRGLGPGPSYSYLIHRFLLGCPNSVQESSKELVPDEAHPRPCSSQCCDPRCCCPHQRLRLKRRRPGRGDADVL
jgi:hypothetical protein